MGLAAVSCSDAAYRPIRSDSYWLDLLDPAVDVLDPVVNLLDPGIKTLAHLSSFNLSPPDGQVQKAAEARLPAEPPDSSPSSCRIAIRMPDGQRLQRRFDKLIDTVQVGRSPPAGC